MKAALDEKFNTNTILLKGAGGVYTVEFNGSLLFKKGHTDDFPTEKHIIDLITSKYSQ